MGAILRAFVEHHRWITQQLRCEFRTVPGAGQFPPIDTAGVTIWTPPVRALVRGFATVVDLGDPLVPAGAAATVAVGVITNGAYLNQVLMLSTAHATLNAAGGQVQGWTSPQAIVAGGFLVSPPTSGGVAFWPANELWPTETQGARSLAVACNADTYTGTLLFTFQWTRY